MLLTILTPVIHPSSRHRYVTGQPALSVPVDEEMSDWHLCSEWDETTQPVPIAGEAFPSTEHLWDTQGVHDQTEFLIGSGIIDHGPVFVASPARAMLDMLYAVLARQWNPTFINVDQTNMTDASRNHLVAMLRILVEREPSTALQNWIDRQSELSRLMAQSGESSLHTPGPAQVGLPLRISAHDPVDR